MCLPSLTNWMASAVDWRGCASVCLCVCVCLAFEEGWQDVEWLWEGRGWRADVCHHNLGVTLKERLCWT